MKPDDPFNWYTPTGDVFHMSLVNAYPFKAASVVMQVLSVLTTPSLTHFLHLPSFNAALDNAVHLPHGRQ